MLKEEKTRRQRTKSTYVHISGARRRRKKTMMKEKEDKNH
jgi:hypothetical protein